MIKYILVALVFNFSSLSYASEILEVNGKVVHPGCVYELTTRADGDNIVSSVHLTRTTLRGCLSSNKYSQKFVKDGKGFYFKDKSLFGKGSFFYEVIAKNKNIYAIRTVEHGDGSFVQRDILITKLEERSLTYFKKLNEKEVKKVLTLSLVGELPNTFDVSMAKKAIQKLY
tara:strand:+ start:48783 stop:49295 length:513 start_codon:yes stop_codon:yes gene_type:complete